MRLPVFLLGLVVVVAASFLIGRIAGFGGLTLAAFVVAVAVLAQLAFVVFVGLQAVVRARRRGEHPGERPMRSGSARVSQRNDA